MLSRYYLSSQNVVSFVSTNDEEGVKGQWMEDPYRQTAADCRDPGSNMMICNGNQARGKR